MLNSINPNVPNLNLHSKNVKKQNNMSFKANITNESFNGVNSASTGIVVKINKNDNVYSITIKDEKEFEYTYNGLINLDVSLYSYVLVNDVIGSVENKDNYFSYTITITKNNNFYSLLNIYE